MFEPVVQQSTGSKQLWAPRSRAAASCIVMPNHIRRYNMRQSYSFPLMTTTDYNPTPYYSLLRPIATKHYLLLPTTTYYLIPTTYLQPTTYDLPPTTCNYGLRPTTYGLRPTTYDLRATTYSLRPTAYGPRPTTDYRLPTTYDRLWTIDY